MNNRVVRFVLIVTAVLFVAGMSWAIVALTKRSDNPTVEQTNNNQPTQDKSTDKQTPSKTKETAKTVGKTTKKQSAPSPTVYYAQEDIVVVEYYYEVTATASASASAGSTSAEAHAE
ncbi:MAG: hypothetical protein WEC81_00860 [Patescibacteria group bacterium]